MRKRRGYSLVEVLVVGTVGTIIASLSIKILSHSYLNAREAQERLDWQRGIVQCETQLRTDLRAAQAVTMPDEQTLVLEKPASQVTYAIKKKYVERTETQDDQKRNSEGYLLPDCQITFKLPETNQVLVQIEPLASGQLTRTFSIRQSVGRP
ncbi:hypothetical protein DTL42_24380 [Bremerella cremea]|uniref:Prepilin-type N-terminal cleavage/methylation domain-containing protein n=1 Tax=Bremerella cremea TaxID=1031537 RepID=A0A368KIY6_9BACT|nr:prepilin-type N-terminal cleavage/methylation domain-containing protein [Bremerella cremea]RCS40514.1 hypothetical protein DTL42_24380 [Bremerella cremea]